MAQRSDVPFNVKILNLTPERLRGLKPVRALDISAGASSQFHEDGLFSVSIFGKMGDERRGQRFSYIDIHVSVFHPVIYRSLLQLKRLYGGIMSSTEYAIWNDEIKDFERASSINGQTGYHFFLSKWKEIEFGKSKSVIREENSKLIAKYKDIALTSKIIVMPAGKRDIEIEDGRKKEDEINSFYRKLLSLSNTVTSAAVEHNPEIINSARYSLQINFNHLYDYIENMVQGKSKLLMGRWASRRIMNGTRNVITAMDTSSAYLGAPGALNFNNTVIGLYQAMKAAMPRARYYIRNGFLQQVFRDVGAPVRLVNKKTFESEEVQLRPQYYDRWMTDEGIEKVMTSFSDEDIRHKAIEIEGRYLGLIYKGPDGTFKIIQDINEVPDTRSKKDVSPLTFCELLYASTHACLQGLPLLVTRYPVTGVGSVVPSQAYVKTTIRSESRKELGPNWEPLDDVAVAREFPLRGVAFVNSVAPHSSRLAGLGADFDGDTVSANITYSDNSIEEMAKYLKTKKAYVGTDGRFLNSTQVSTISLVMHNLTGPVL